MKKKNKNIAIGVAIIVFLALLSFSGSKYYNYNQSLLNDAIRRIDSITELSQQRQDSLVDVLVYSEQRVYDLEYRWKQAEKRNNYLYAKLKEREKDLYNNDTSFINNASRISNGVNRYYQPTDGIR